MRVLGGTGKGYPARVCLSVLIISLKKFLNSIITVNAIISGLV